jgi:hypothetical protein
MSAWQLSIFSTYQKAVGVVDEGHPDVYHQHSRKGGVLILVRPIRSFGDAQ